MKKLVLALSIGLAILVFAPSCSTTKLATGGPYAVTNQQPDLAFYVADGSFDVAYQAFNAAFTFEYNNRAMLWKVSPNIKHTLDLLRPQAKMIVTDYITARKVYIANPTPLGLTNLQQLVAKAQALSASASAVMANHQ